MSQDEHKMAQDGQDDRQDKARLRQDAKTLIFLMFFKVFGGGLGATNPPGSPTTQRARAPGRVGRGP